MGNPLKKTMVFLGLAEEDFEAANAAPSTRTNETTDLSNETVAAPVASKVAQRAPVTPLRKVTPTRAQSGAGVNEILTVHPTAYKDAAAIAESFRDGVPVILNLSRMDEAEAKRLIDFSSGLAMGLRGRIERVTSKVFLLSPEHIATNSDADESETQGTFFVTPTA